MNQNDPLNLHFWVNFLPLSQLNVNLTALRFEPANVDPRLSLGLPH